MVVTIIIYNPISVFGKNFRTVVPAWGRSDSALFQNIRLRVVLWNIPHLMPAASTSRHELEYGNQLVMAA